MAETSGEHHHQGEQTHLPDNSVLVGSGKPSAIDALLEKQTDRRGFLSLLAKGVGGLGAAVMTAAIPTSVVEAGRSSEVKFHAVGPDESIRLYTGTSMTSSAEYIIHAFGAESTLQVRLDQDQKMVCKPFDDGETTERAYGEILDPRLSKLIRTSELASDVPIGMYYSVSGNKDRSSLSREDLKENNCWGIPVITQKMDYGLSGSLPVEHNKLNAKEDFGIGWAVGKLRETNGKKIFDFRGFVLDSRALVPAAV